MNLQDQEELYLKAKKAYYDGEPIMDDPTFDELEQDLKAIGSDVVNIVGDNEDTGNRLPHWSPMLSLAKISADLDGNPPTADFEKWHQGILQKLGVTEDEVEYESQPKLDGNSANLQYRGGKLYRGLTRGNEKGGKDISSKTLHFAPASIEFLEDCEIRGEVIIEKSVFETKYKNRAAGVNKAYKNPRNYVGGVLNKDDLDQSILDDLKFVAFNIRKFDGKNKYVSNEVDYIDSLGFNPKFKFLRTTFKGAKGFAKLFAEYTKYRAEIDFPLDGFVITIKNAEQRQEIGENSHDPDYSLAVKFPPKQANTEILGIEWNMSNFGEMVPVALLQPVDLDGSVVKRASLASWGNLQMKKCYPGAVVTIAKAGDIIPHIYKVVKDGDAKFAIPTVCFSCGNPLFIDESHITCKNILCDEQVRRRFKSIMAILGYQYFGGSTMNDFYDAGFRTPADFFGPKMNKNYLIGTGIFKDGRALDKLLIESKRLKSIKLEKLINCFKLKGVGQTASLQIAKQISGQEYSFSNLEKEPLEGYDDPTNLKRILLDELITNLNSYGIAVDAPNSHIDKNLKTYKLTLTGSPKPLFSSKEEYLESFSGKINILETKIKDSDYLITDTLNSSSGKMISAKKLGKEILTYEQFFKKINPKLESNLESNLESKTTILELF